MILSEQKMVPFLLYSALMSYMKQAITSEIIIKMAPFLFYIAPTSHP